MSLTSYLYQGEVPEPDSVLDMARQLLVASTLSNHALSEETCAEMLDGLAAVYVGAVRHHCERETRICDDASHAERIYVDAANGTYMTALRRAYPDYDPDPEVLMWPDAMRYREGWPLMFVLSLGRTLGEVEGDRSVAVFRWMREQEQKGARQ